MSKEICYYSEFDLEIEENWGLWRPIRFTCHYRSTKMWSKNDPKMECRLCLLPLKPYPNHSASSSSIIILSSSLSHYNESYPFEIENYREF